MLRAGTADEAEYTERQGETLLRATLITFLYQLYPEFSARDVDVLVNALCTPSNINRVATTTCLQDVLLRCAHGVSGAPSTASLPSLIALATRRSSPDVVRNALMEAFSERTAELHDNMPRLHAEALPTVPPSELPARPDSPLTKRESREPVQAPTMHRTPSKPDPHYISLLAEWAQRDPLRRILAYNDTASGPSHLRFFEVTCALNDELIGVGRASRKQSAKALAAFDAAEHLGLVVRSDLSRVRS